MLRFTAYSIHRLTSKGRHPTRLLLHSTMLYTAETRDIGLRADEGGAPVITARNESTVKLRPLAGSTHH